ncbi:MAG: TonB-dependent receptor [Massilia sp.]|nr:TonB-dependent receptor [Massilia sp.]
MNIAGPGTLARRQSDTTAKLVVNHDEIVRFGDTSVSDVLRRLPGVTVSGDIRLRGLGNGYTQILVNGDPVAPGFSVDALSPELIERIELLRSPTVEYATQAIAGTINIVLRKAATSGQREVKLGAVSDRAGTTPNVSLQLAERLADFSYTVTGIARQEKIVEPGGMEQVTGAQADGSINLRRTSRYQYSIANQSLSLAPRLQWTPGNGSSLSVQNYVELSESMRGGGTLETALLGAPSAYPSNAFSASNRIETARSDLAWSHSGAHGVHLDAKFGIHHNLRTIHYAFIGNGPDAASSLLRRVASGARDNELTSSGKAAAPFFTGHHLVAGWDGAITRRGEYRRQDDFDGNGAAQGALDEHYDATVKRLAFFVQDEWDLTPRWQMYLGLRWEGLATDSLSNVVAPVHQRSSVWSPVLQTLWKLPGLEKDQVRLGLARTYKAPTTSSLIPRRYTANNDNGPTNPDRQGNPQLRPELAWGLDAAWEHYFAKSGVLSVNAFVRRIQDVTIERLSAQNGKWIASPVNDGNAAVRGIELEARVPLAAVVAHAPAIEFKFNLARNWSTLDALPGPNNRLDGQTPLSANLGLDYRANERVSAGGNASFKSAGPVTVSLFVSNDAAPTRTLDLYGVMKMSPLTQWRASAFNLLQQDSTSARTFADDSGSMQRSTRSRSNRGLRVTLEHKFSS